MLKSVALLLIALWLARALLRRLSAITLEDRVILITGASRGLGLVLARECARAGSRIVICARSAKELADAEADLRRWTRHVLSVSCDLTQPEEVRRLAAAVRARFGGVDILINNAGVIQVGPCDTMTTEDDYEAIRLHVWAPLRLILEVLPDMRRQRWGRIVNISSIGGKISAPHLVPYSASKFALTGLSQGLCAELRKDGVVVTTAYPGLMRTGSPPQATFKGQHRKEYAWFSISDSLPLLTVSARRILWACRCGDVEVIVGWPALVASKIAALFPATTIRWLSLVNRLLPHSGGIGSRRAKGYQSQSRLSPSMWTRLTERAADENNERHHNGSRFDPT